MFIKAIDLLDDNLYKTNALALVIKQQYNLSTELIIKFIHL